MVFDAFHHSLLHQLHFTRMIRQFPIASLSASPDRPHFARVCWIEPLPLFSVSNRFVDLPLEVISLEVIELAPHVQFGARTLKIRFSGHIT